MNRDRKDRGGPAKPKRSGPTCAPRRVACAGVPVGDSCAPHPVGRVWNGGRYVVRPTLCKQHPFAKGTTDRCP